MGHVTNTCTLAHIYTFSLHGEHVNDEHVYARVHIHNIHNTFTKHKNIWQHLFFNNPRPYLQSCSYGFSSVTFALRVVSQHEARQERLVAYPGDYCPACKAMSIFSCTTVFLIFMSRPICFSENTISEYNQRFGKKPNFIIPRTDKPSFIICNVKYAQPCGRFSGSGLLAQAWMGIGGNFPVG